MVMVRDGTVDDPPVPSGGGMARRRTLGDEVKRRRGELGLSQVALAREGKVALATLGAIERGDRRWFQAATLAGLDRALGWKVGEAQRLLDDEHAETETEPSDAVVAAIDQLRVEVAAAVAERRRPGGDELAALVDAMDPAERAMVISVIQFLIDHRPRSR